MYIDHKILSLSLLIVIKTWSVTTFKFINWRSYLAHVATPHTMFDQVNPIKHVKNLHANFKSLSSSRIFQQYFRFRLQLSLCTRKTIGRLSHIKLLFIVELKNILSILAYILRLYLCLVLYPSLLPLLFVCLINIDTNLKRTDRIRSIDICFFARKY